MTTNLYTNEIRAQAFASCAVYTGASPRSAWDMADGYSNSLHLRFESIEILAAIIVTIYDGPLPARSIPHIENKAQSLRVLILKARDSEKGNGEATP